MAHVGTQGVTDVREVEDVLLAHIGLVPNLKRAGRPTSVELDQRLCVHLNRDVAELYSWLTTHYAVVEQRLSILSWQSWASDNQIIASVQTLMGEGAVAMGRERPLWKENWETDSKRSTGAEVGLGFCKGLWIQLTRSGQSLGQVRIQLTRSGQSLGQVPTKAGHVLIVCALNECGGLARLLQQQLSERLQCEVVISTNQVDAWLDEVEDASRGVVLLQVPRLQSLH